MPPAAEPAVAPAIRLGEPADIESAVSIFERSNLARHQGVWPGRATSVARVRGQLHAPYSWFLMLFVGAARSARPAPNRCAARTALAR